MGVSFRQIILVPDKSRVHGLVIIPTASREQSRHVTETALESIFGERERSSAKPETSSASREMLRRVRVHDFAGLPCRYFDLLEMLFIGNFYAGNNSDSNDG